MPAYSIQQDPPWIQKPVRGSLAPSASVYSDDDEIEIPRLLNHPDMPTIAPLRLHKAAKPSPHPSYHAHRGQQIRDAGPQLRQSRLPIFKQVRGLLHRPPPADTSVKYDLFSGNISAAGKAPNLKPPAYHNPYEGTFEARRGREPRSPPMAQGRLSSTRSVSPVSVLNDEEAGQRMYSPDLGWNNEISPVSDTEEDKGPLRPSQVSANARSTQPVPETPPQPSIKVIKRKPAPSRHSLSPENIPPQSSSSVRDSNTSNVHDTFTTQPDRSHFSWTTCAPSIAPTVASADADNRASSRHSNHSFGEVLPASRFSWSTVNTQMTNQMRPVSPPPSPPPPMPTKYKTPPVQSILSRHRPIQRNEREQWTPPARKTSLPQWATGTPTSARSKLTIASEARSDTASGVDKKLPLPPELLTPVSPMSHLETLLTEEQDKIHQRKNIERLIAELSKTESASPLDVSFAQLKDVKKKLGELRTTLAEVQLEEREIGIAIARTRRKEGEEEGLWVRRVTS